MLKRMSYAFLVLKEKKILVFYVNCRAGEHQGSISSLQSNLD